MQSWHASFTSTELAYTSFEYSQDSGGLKIDYQKLNIHKKL